VCELYIGDTLINVQCKENAAAMHLCNKTTTNRAGDFAAGIARRKCRYSRQIESFIVLGGFSAECRMGKIATLCGAKRQANKNAPRREA
jgi:hypothetical protein